MKEVRFMRRDNSRDDLEILSGRGLESILFKLEEYGFPLIMIRNTIESNSINHLSATYLLLLQKQMSR